jgi:hypothetical protein
MNYNCYVLHILSAGLWAEVTLNGWRPYRKRQAELRAFEHALDPWLLEGENVLEARLGPLPKQDQGDDLYFKVILCRRMPNHPPEVDDTMALFCWTPEEHPLEDGVLTPVFSHEFTMREAFGHWAWQDARPYAIQDRPEVEALVVMLHQALARRNLGTLMAALRLKQEEMSRAFALTLDRHVEGQEENLRALFAAPDWQMAPLDPAKLVIESSAGGRLVHVYHPDGEEPLRGGGSGGLFALGLTVSRIAGSWEVVR